MRKSILAIGIACCSWHMASAQQAMPSLGTEAFTLVRFLDKHHYQPRTWNDSSSALLFDHWLELLDDEHLLLLQSDRQLLETYRYQLDDEIRRKESVFFKTSVDLLFRRLHQVDSILQTVITRPVDYSKPETYQWSRTTDAASLTEMAQRWNAFVKWRILDAVMDEAAPDTGNISLKQPANFAQLENDVRIRLKKKELLFIQNLLKDETKTRLQYSQAYLDAIAWCYDPHSNYMDLASRNEFEADVHAQQFTFGFDFKETENGDRVISLIQPGSSAWKSGQLHVGDQLKKLKSGTEEKNATELDSWTLRQWLNGSEHRSLELTVISGNGEEKVIRLIKEKITDDESVVKSYLLQQTPRIGYIQLPGFYSQETEDEKPGINGCANDVSREIIKLKKDNIAGLILDLRDNGGGSMWEAMQLAGIFIDIGPVASIKDKSGKVAFLKDPNRGTIYDGPLLVLINERSASASEFFSAALQDHNRALIAGTTSFGKGTMQDVLPLDTLAPEPEKVTNATVFAKVTEGQFYRINGSTVQWKGVVPDIRIPEINFSAPEREQQYHSAILPDSSRKAYYTAMPAIPVDELRRTAEKRMQDNRYFQLVATIDNWKASGNNQSIVLQWQTLAERKNNRRRWMQEITQAAENSRLQVQSNSFDLEIQSRQSNEQKDILKSYRDEIGRDPVLLEAVRVIQDWIRFH